MPIRECEFCKDHTKEYLEEFYYSDYVCGACSGTKELDSRECFCCAYTPSECGCDADWSDYIYYEDDEE